jgi:hypothetical protein
MAPYNTVAYTLSEVPLASSSAHANFLRRKLIEDNWEDNWEDNREGSWDEALRLY